MFDGFTIPVVLLAVAFGAFAGLLYSKTRLKQAAALLDRALAQNRANEEQIRAFLVEMGKKDVLIERAAGLLESGSEKMQEAERERELLKVTVDFQKTQYEKLLHQKKSSEVRTGKITEQLSPFLAGYPEDPATARFLGDPIDFVHFGSEAVVFVEVKSGKSQLNSNQRRIRDLVKDGKVEFKVYRVEGEDEGDKGTV